MCGIFNSMHMCSFFPHTINMYPPDWFCIFLNCANLNNYASTDHNNLSYMYQFLDTCTRSIKKLLLPLVKLSW